MQQYYHVLVENTLFSGFDIHSLEPILKCLGAYKKSFSKGDTVRPSDVKVTEIGIVVSGVVYIVQTDFEGNRKILSEVTKGKSFGESLVFSGAENSPVTVTAAKESVVVFIHAENITSRCAMDCKFHDRLMNNVTTLLSEKIMLLQMKNDILSQKTTRDRLWMYLSYESRTRGSKAFRIHFSRNELADFLSINSSAMSRELGKMRDEGLLTFHKNKFVLKEKTKSIQ